jgi:exportin-1
LKCLTEIGSLSVGSEYGEKIVSLFTIVMTSVNSMIPPSTDICAVYENSSDDDQEFVQNLAIFLTSFLSSHNKVRYYSPMLVKQFID